MTSTEKTVLYAIVSVVIIALVFVGGLALGLSVHPPDKYAYERGYEKGRAVGYKEGGTEGYRQGHEKGKQIGAKEQIDISRKKTRALQAEYEEMLRGKDTLYEEAVARFEQRNQQQTSAARRAGYDAAQSEIEQTIALREKELRETLEARFAVQLKIARKQAREEALAEGGYYRGYEDGMKEGKKRAERAESRLKQEYQRGRKEGEAEGTEKGRQRGHAKGYEEGHADGEKDGYRRGYNDGHKDGLEQKGR